MLQCGRDDRNESRIIHVLVVSLNGLWLVACKLSFTCSLLSQVSFGVGYLIRLTTCKYVPGGLDACRDTFGQSKSLVSILQFA